MPSYNNIVTDISNAMVVPSTDSNFVTMLPNWIQLAENRIYRELNLLDASVRDSSASTTSMVRNFNLPTTVGTFLIVDDINIITPAGTAPEGGTRVRLVPMSLAVLDWIYPSSAGATVPIGWAYASQNTYLTGNAAQSQIVFGPWPDNVYRVEVIGKIQPAVISASNLNSWLTDNLYDLLFKAIMYEAAAWQQNFGATTDNPQSPATWNASYNTARDSAATWAARARLGGASWTSAMVEPTAQPQRG